MSSDWPVASALMAGRYRLVSLLETGGMAEIWRAEDELLDRPVAVKLPTGPQVVWREARMAARLSHPGIAAVHDYREAVRPDGAVVPFVVMELLTGESVAARVDRELVGWAEAARIGAAVADALAAAHASGVVHRDIKPGNVMLTPNGVKILDFGISVAAGEPDDDDTGATFGTPAYVAPERLDGMPAEPATDVYGVGVLLFEMVTGDPPYPVETWEELAAARVSGPSELPESLPADFRDVVNRCLDPDPARRPTAARLRADLLAVALRSRPPAPAGGPVAGPATAGPATAGPAATGSAANGPSASGLATAGLAAGGAAARGPAAGLAAGKAAMDGGPAVDAQSASSGTGSAGAGGAARSGVTFGATSFGGTAAGDVAAGSAAAGSAAAGDVAAGGTAFGRGAARIAGMGSEGDGSGETSRAEASGSVGNLVRAAGGSADQWAGGPVGHRGATDGEGGSASRLGADGVSAEGGGPAGSTDGGAGRGPAESGRGGTGRNTPADHRFAGAPAGTPSRAAPSQRAGNLSSPSEGTGNLSSPSERAGNLTSPSERAGNLTSPSERAGNLTSPSARAGNLTSPSERAGNPSSPSELAGNLSSRASSPRSAFAYADSDEARDWRPDGQEAGGRSQRPRTGPPGSRRPMGTRNFATGRAAAATLDMRESPRRRTVFGIGAAVVLAALAGAFAVLTWTHRYSDRDVAVPPPATTPVVPTVTATTPSPPVTSAGPTSARPSPKATTLTFADAVSRMRDAVRGGEASGQIRRDVAQDLLNLLGPLSNAQGSDLTGQVQALRQKIQTRVGEGGVTQARAAVLQSRLEDLDRAAGT